MQDKAIKTADTIIVDTESTGLRQNEDGTQPEILQLAIIDIDGNVLFNDYFQPLNNRYWPNATKIHGNTPEDVIGFRLIRVALPEIQQLFDSAKKIIGFNFAYYDSHLLMQSGINIDRSKIDDVFDEIVTHIPDSKKWPTLSQAAEVIGYDWKSHQEVAHNALGDCYATLAIYNSLRDNSYFQLKKTQHISFGHFDYY